jgi:hypothetical protein
LAFRNEIEKQNFAIKNSLYDSPPPPRATPILNYTFSTWFNRLLKEYRIKYMKNQRKNFKIKPEYIQEPDIFVQSFHNITNYFRAGMREKLTSHKLYLSGQSLL